MIVGVTYPVLRAYELRELYSEIPKKNQKRGGAMGCTRPLNKQIKKALLLAEQFLDDFAAIGNLHRTAVLASKGCLE